MKKGGAGSRGRLVLVQSVCHDDRGKAPPGCADRMTATQAGSLAGRGRRTDPGEPSRSVPVTTIYRQMAPGRPSVGVPGPSVWTALLMRGVRAAAPDTKPVRQRECL